MTLIFPPKHNHYAGSGTGNVAGTRTGLHSFFSINFTNLLRKLLRENHLELRKCDKSVVQVRFFSGIKFVLGMLMKVLVH